MTAADHEWGVAASEPQDDEALGWGASSDSSYVEGPEVVTPSDAPVDVEEADEEDEAPEGVMSSTMLVVLGLFGGLYLLVTLAWLISAGRATPPSLSGFSLFMWHLGQYLAVIAAPVWFVATLAVTPMEPGRRRILWLVVGLLVLLPWPLVTGTGGAQ